jgi:outer membrane protein assembly factor BamB
MLADGMFLVMDGNTGKLHAIEASTIAYNEISSAQVLAGQEVWAPMALSDGKLVLRDLTRMICLDLRG